MENILIGIIVTLSMAVIGAQWTFIHKLSKKLDTYNTEIWKKLELTNTAIAGLNNAIIMQISVAETKADERALGLERDITTFKLYCEQQFMSKNSFEKIMGQQSIERDNMKIDIMRQLSELKAMSSSQGKKQDRMMNNE